MHIEDLNGKRIEITDLNAAIRQAKAFVAYRHENAEYIKLAKELRPYWLDMLQKLKALRQSKQQH